MKARSLRSARVLAGISLTVSILAGCPATDPALCAQPDLGADADNSPCGIGSEPRLACPWVCGYSPHHGYEWIGEGCCAPVGGGINAGDGTPCGSLGARLEPCAWRCTFDPRDHGSYHWEELYQGCGSSEDS